MRQSEKTNGIDVFWNGDLLSSVSAVGSNAHNRLVYIFLVKGLGNGVLKFTATGIEDTLGGSLDTIKVSALPIPAAAFLFTPPLLDFMGLPRKATTPSF